MSRLTIPTFSNEFDLTEKALSEVIIRANHQEDNCFIWDSINPHIAYNSFILTKNSRSKIICQIAFYKSSITHKYIPRLIFKRLLLSDEEQFSKSEKKVSILLDDSSTAQNFWELIGFLSTYKDIVDTGKFENLYQVVSKDNYFVEFRGKSEKSKMEDLKELISIAELSTSNIAALAFKSRKQNLLAFFYLLKNKILDNGIDSHTT